MGWSASLAQDGNFHEVSDDRFLSAYLGIPLVRLQIIDCLRVRRNVTRPDLARSLGWTTGGLRVHLEVLEDLGLIVSTRVRVPSSFKPVTSYQLNTARLEDVACALARTLNGRDRPTGAYGRPVHEDGMPLRRGGGDDVSDAAGVQGRHGENLSKPPKHLVGSFRQMLPDLTMSEGRTTNGPQPGPFNERGGS